MPSMYDLEEARYQEIEERKRENNSEYDKEVLEANIKIKCSKCGHVQDVYNNHCSNCGIKI